jgi:1-aminocyclopropane-1-carboxylate deaminase/D-cysteine desulfhydrase-like pyridoxal-dependent ACC family enzyme
MTALPRVALVHGPTPIPRRRALDELPSVDLWIKRDDATGAAEAGNKVRKLEWLLGDALSRRADTVVTCGGLPSNHARTTRIAREARSWDGSLGPPAPFVVDDHARGPAYAVSTAEQRGTVVGVARASGLVLDPVHCGKAMHGLKAAVERGDIRRGSRVLFLHTGGLPGLLAQGDAFGAGLA